MDQVQDKPAEAVFDGLFRQIAALGGREPAEIRAGHLDLGPDLWLSCDPGGQAVMTCRPAEGGFHLTLAEGGSGGWACLGMRLAPGALAGGRYLGLLIRATPGAVLSVTPSLRYFLDDGGTEEAAPGLPVVLPGGAPREHLAHIPLDHSLRARAKTCELNLFFHNDAMAVDITLLEPLLIS